MKHTFSAVIENAGGGGAFVTVPFDVERAFGRLSYTHRKEYVAWVEEAGSATAPERRVVRRRTVRRPKP